MRVRLCPRVSPGWGPSPLPPWPLLLTPSSSSHPRPPRLLSSGAGLCRACQLAGLLLWCCRGDGSSSFPRLLSLGCSGLGLGLGSP